MPDFNSLKEKGSNILDTIKKNPEFVTTPIGAGAGAMLSSAMQDPDNKSILKTLLGAGIGAGAGYGAGWSMKPGDNIPAPPKVSADENSAMYNLLWGHRQGMGKSLTAAATLALLAIAGKKGVKMYNVPTVRNGVPTTEGAAAMKAAKGAYNAVKPHLANTVNKGIGGLKFVLRKLGL